MIFPRIQQPHAPAASPRGDEPCRGQRARALRRLFAPRGFSLPEVTIAVGIAALGLVTLLGLMPQGLEMSRKTGELAAQRQIVEQITRDFEQMPWAELRTLAGNGAGQTRSFNDQGMEVAVGDLNTSYIVNVRVFDLTAQLPQGGGPEAYLRKVVIRVATSTNPAYNFDAPANQPNFATFHTYVARSR